MEVRPVQISTIPLATGEKLSCMTNVRQNCDEALVGLDEREGKAPPNTNKMTSLNQTVLKVLKFKSVCVRHGMARSILTP